MLTAELETYAQAVEVRASAPSLAAAHATGAGPRKGRHIVDSDVLGLGAVGVWECAQGGEEWAVQHLREANARVGGTATKANCRGEAVLL